jgi:hypothetical protein
VKTSVGIFGIWVRIVKGIEQGVNYDDQNRFEFNVYALNTCNFWHVRVMENLMPRFYFILSSKDAHIPDDFGEELDTLHDAYMHARKLIDKILFRVGHEDAGA